MAGARLDGFDAAAEEGIDGDGFSASARLPGRSRNHCPGRS
jgi:hypothetical protein